MKFLQFILIGVMCITIDSKNFTKNILFENCKNTDWWVKNISPSLPVDNKINFEAEVGFGEKTASSGHLIKYTLTNCSDLWCKSHENLTVEGLNCAVNSTEVEKEPCLIAKILVDWTQNATNLRNLSVKKLKNGCVNYDVAQPVEKKPNPLAPGSLFEPFIKNIPMNPALAK
ncbi:uncharacterized protein LOC130677287 [Microplitis mediator]|uniref:uncharacterized protein LOC130677287 n=1 Tax=Microplitis mediator TaxID=375433 RepID=UPI002556A802|nr:uncharacterized protein LOC130677287 [Microplitis mediator]